VSEYFWHCPFCNRDESVTEESKHASFADLNIENADGPRRLVVKYVVCPNPQCRKFSLIVSLHGLELTGNRAYTGKHIKTWALIPPSRALSFPVLVPQKVLDDYQEACLTIEFSPKVSAALARRCLSEMLRDFWQVQPGRLIDEFRQIKGTVDPLTWEAIESVKKCGMIGARFESEGTQILDTEPGEAKMLIGLIETLVEDWYVAREERRNRLEKIRQISIVGAGEGEKEE
jgi:hypothetical protein